MAIIYETKEDFERDKIKEQAKDVYIQSANQAATGMASVVVGSLVNDFNRSNSGFMKLAGLTASVFGGVKIVQSLFTMNKAHNLHLEKERMGPQTVVYPSDDVLSSGVVMSGGSSEKKCCSGCKSSNIKPTSLLEQAEKRLSELGRQ